MPDHWQSTTLGEACDLEIGRTPPRKETDYWTSSLERPFCTIADMDGRVIFPNREGVTELALRDQKARRVEAGSLLMSFKLTIGRVAFAGCDLFPNEAIVAITPDDGLTSREFLYLNLGSRDLTEGSGQAVKGKTLNSKSLRAIDLDLPPLAEQRRIVDLVGAIDAYIDALEAQIEATRTTRMGVLSELLSNPGEDWRSTSLGEACDLVIGRTPPRKETDYWTSSLERPFCTIADMDGRVIFPNREGVTELAVRDQKVRKVEAGSLLMSFKLTIGRVAFAGCDLFPNEAIVAITPDDGLTSREFLYLNLGSRDLTEGSGQAVKGKTLNSKSLRAIDLDLPPLAEQRRIVDLVGAIDEQIERLESQVAAARDLRSGVLSDLLSGDRLLSGDYEMAVGL
jgi:restriction endonuclease S subunit